MPYQPTPIDTSRVKLPAAVDDLIERLAEHNHHVWARGRLADGWVWGPQRDDARKHHPCLVDYRELPESEKQYDRHTAAEVLKAIVAMGFRIERA
jgi:ryanodine receptor 2